MSSRLIRIPLLVPLIACGIVSAGPFSSFDQTDEGWKRYSVEEDMGPFNPVISPVQYKPQGHICADDPDTGTWYFRAPDKFHGNQLETYSQFLTFSLKQNPTIQGFEQPDIYLVGGNGLVLAYDTPYNPEFTFTPYAIPLTEFSGWRIYVGGQFGPVPTRGQFDSVLGDITELWIRGEFAGDIADTGCLDDVVLGGAAVPTKVNIDIVNRGPAAAGFRTVLGIMPEVTDMFAGRTMPNPMPPPQPPLPRGFFRETGKSGQDYVILRWDNWEDDDNDIVDTNQIFHPGWTTTTATLLADMYWVDAEGNRVPGSAVHNLTPVTAFFGSIGKAQVHFENAFAPSGLPTATISISDLEYAVLDHELALADLTPANQALEAAFLPFPGGSFDVLFGDRITLNLPDGVDFGSVIVYRYRASAPGSAADQLTYVQAAIPVPEPAVTGLAAAAFFSGPPATR